MSFELITTARGPGLFSGLRRKLVHLLGVLFFLSGLAASGLLLIFAIVAVVALIKPGADFPELDAETMSTLLGALIVTVVGLKLGLKLIRGSRRLVLFLRRFGYEEATRALSFAAASAMGKRWRLVTLDDSEIAPVLGLETSGRILRLLRWLLLVAVVAVLLWLFGGGFENYLGKIIDDMPGSNRGGGFGDLIGQLFAMLILTIFVGLIIGALVMMLVGILGAGAVFSWRSFQSYRKAELSQSRSIDDTRQIESVIAAVRELSGRIFAPQLVVVRVNSAIWQPVVARFAEVSAVILIDVSSPGEGLLWELQNLKAKYRQRIVLVGEHDAMQALAALSADKRHGEDVNHRLIDQLDGEQVLVYRGDTKRDMKRFARLLRSILNKNY